MLFNSVHYFIFLPVFFALYWLINPYLKVRNLLILGASYYFYGCWDPKFLILIIASTFVDYFIGDWIEKSEKHKLKILWISIAFNIGLLFYFKYFNFFIESFATLLEGMGFEPNITSLNIILPVGISFYTFQTLSYSIDIYRGQLKPVKNFIDFASFVAFFPQLVAGPIERAKNLLPQITTKREFSFEMASDGMRLILFGLVKKVVIADSLSVYVDQIFSNPEAFNGGELFLGATYFSFQVYCDFSGYSDIAIGSAMLLGFHIMSNFKFPYFSTNLAEFWRRWHISLNTWLNEYLFMSIALFARNYGKYAIVLSLLFTFTVSGLWHGAAWNFVLWGFTTGVFFIIPLLRKGKRIKGLGGKTTGEIVFNKTTIPKMFLTTFLSIITFAMFRSTSVENIGVYFKRLLFNFDIPVMHKVGILYVLFIIVLDYIFRKDERKVLIISKYRSVQYLFYLILLTLVIYSSDNSGDFIYFQF